jgi:hypothetical protein
MSGFGASVVSVSEEKQSRLPDRVPDYSSLTTRQSPDSSKPSSGDDLRWQANAAKIAASESKSPEESRRHRKRAKALNDMADNEDWLDGKSKAKD